MKCIEGQVDRPVLSLMDKSIIFWKNVKHSNEVLRLYESFLGKCEHNLLSDFMQNQEDGRSEERRVGKESTYWFGSRTQLTP